MNRRLTLTALALLLALGSLASLNTAGAQTDDAPLGTVWRRVPSNTAEFGGDGDQVPADVTAGGPGFVAVGNDSFAALVQPAVWLSDDGTSWTRVTLGSETVDPATTHRFDAVAARDGTVVAVGTEGIECAGNFDLSIWGSCERSRPAIWWSPDGQTWNRVPPDPAIFHDAGDSTMVDVVAAEDGFYAVGNRRVRDAWDVDIWFSEDGRVWELSHQIDTRWPLAAGSIAATPAGIIAFVTEHVDREVRPIAAVLRGGGWVLETPAAEDRTPAGQVVAVGTDATSFSDHVIGEVADYAGLDHGGPVTWFSGSSVFALGPLQDGRRTIHRSEDGATWTSFTAEMLTAGPPALARVLQLGAGVLAVQFASEEGALTTPTWLSVDGALWSPAGVAAPPLEPVRQDTGAGGIPGGAVEVATDGTNAVAVGVDATGGDADAAFWFAATGPVADPGAGTVPPPAEAEFVTPDGCPLGADASCPASELDGAALAGLAAPGADLSLSNLIGADLSGADLRGANLDGADLRDANLSNADLSGASLEATGLQGATLDGATMVGANLENTDFTGASMSGINASGVEFGGAAFRVGAILAGADLGGAALAAADLTSVDLRGARLDGADLTGANLRGAALDGATVVGATLRQANLSAAALRRADFGRVAAREAAFTLADLRGASFAAADLTNASLFGADLRDADLSDAQVPVANFIEAILVGATLPASGLGDADWGSTVCPDGFVTGGFPSASCAGHEASG